MEYMTHEHDTMEHKYTVNSSCIVIPEYVTEIEAGAFAKDKTLKTIDLSNVRRIGAHAFQECTNLESVIMSNVTEIGQGAFEFCRSLRSITFENITSVGDEAFMNCSMLDIPEMPRSLTQVGAGAFSHTAIRSVDLHWLDEIPASLLSYCTSLTDADIVGAKVIGNDAFAGCRALSEVRLGELEKIGKGAFQKCDAFELVRLPDSLRYIGDDAFSVIRGGLIIPGSVSHIGKDCLGPVDRKKEIRIYRSSLYEFRNYFRDDRADPFDEDEHFYLWESSIDVTVMDEQTGETIGFLPLYSDLERQLRKELTEAFRPDNTFDYSFLDEVLFSGLKWNQRCKDRHAVMRLSHPFELTRSAREEYIAYLEKHLKRIVRRAVHNRDVDMLIFLCDVGLIGRENITDVIDRSISMSASECTAFLLERQSELGCSSDPLLDEL